LGADAPLIDDRAGRREAQDPGLPVPGTLGLTDLAALHDLVDLQTAIARLRETNFRAEERLFQLVLDRGMKRCQRPDVRLVSMSLSISAVM